MATNDDTIHRDLYDKLNANTEKMAGLTAAVQVLAGQNERFFQLMEKKDALFLKALRALFWVTILLVLVVAYGAIGKEGMHSVRDTIPSIPLTTGDTSAYAIPAQDDIGAWFKRRAV